MRFWWVNQNQTFEQETTGGYLWSPKRKAGNQRNPFYEFMREVSPGDVVFSFARTRISAIGAIQSNAFGAPKPEEFGGAGQNWSNIGWKVLVRYQHINHSIKPVDHMSVLGPLRPPRYAPLQPNGKGLQGVYLTHLSKPFAEALIDLIGPEARTFVDAVAATPTPPGLPATPAGETIEWENSIEEGIRGDHSIPETEKPALIITRRGQGKFKQNVQTYESMCRLTKVRKIEHLIASHIKPWRSCETNEERLNGENGLLLTPSMDHLFDRGYISFEDNGDLIVSPVADVESLEKMGIPNGQFINTGSFTLNQKAFLDFHRDQILLKAVLL